MSFPTTTVTKTRIEIENSRRNAKMKVWGRVTAQRACCWITWLFCGVNCANIGDSVNVQYLINMMLAHSPATNVSIVLPTYFHAIMIAPFRFCVSLQTYRVFFTSFSFFSITWKFSWRFLLLLLSSRYHKSQNRLRRQQKAKHSCEIARCNKSGHIRVINVSYIVYLQYLM